MKFYPRMHQLEDGLENTESY